MTKIYSFKLYFKIIAVVYLLFIFTFKMSIALSEVDGNMVIKADKLFTTDNKNKINAQGNISIKTNEFISKSDATSYDKENDEIKASGNVLIKDKLNNFYFFEDIITDQNFNNAIGSPAKIRMNDGVRIVGKSFSRKESKINQINDASYTPCLENNYAIKNCPGWKLNAKKVIHDSERQSVYYEGATLSIFNVPILYSPFFSHPDPTVKKRSGVLMPSFNSDRALGTSVSIPIFYNISSNKDLTVIPTFQTKADDYYSANYRHLTKNHLLNIETSISNNDSKTGTKNHFFLYGDVKNPYGKFDYKIETTNNDTYLRKNQINDYSILKSGLNFTKEMNNSYLDFSSYVYKHLNNSPEQKWEYIYPTINYDIYSYEDSIFKLKWQISNSFLNYRDIDKNYNQQASSEFISKEIKILRSLGIRFENSVQNRFIYFNNSSDNYSHLRIFPQVASKISYPLGRKNKNRTEVLEPVIMPILAPFNNYSNNQGISNSNIFSLNRETSLSQWESGPRINYGLNWLISYENLTINSTAGQSWKTIKNEKSRISDYFISNSFDFKTLGYIKNDITLDRDDLYLKDNNINTSIKIGKIKFGFDYDYESENKQKTSEQISIGTKIDILKNTTFITSARKDLMSDESIGNAFGLHYENDCIALNFDYFHDFTYVGDIKNNKGFSFTLTLKPFGTSKQAGKVRNFGPEL